MANRLEEIAAKSIGYLKRTDALASHDYEPEIKAEFMRAMQIAQAEERERCAEIANEHFDKQAWEIVSTIRSASQETS